MREKQVLKRDHERNAGTEVIRMETIASESMNVNDAERERLFQQEYQAVIDSFFPGC